jgi:putative membrane protein insertion efficiency factor
MGHRDTSEKLGGARGVFDLDGGSFAADGGRDEAAVLRITQAERLNISQASAHQTVELMESSATTATSATNSVGRSPRQHTAAVRAALVALRFYKAYLSMLMAGSCRFEPTCSQFTYQAIERFGVLRGSWLGFKRLLRCQPLSRRFGFDPVPEEYPGIFRNTKVSDSHSVGSSTASDISSDASLSEHKEAHS